MRKVIINLFVVFVLVSCGREAGEGGKNTITGVIVKQEFTKSTDQFVVEYLAPEERIYIIYGDNAFFADEVKTNYDGTFRFDFLYKGTYHLFVYSECLPCPSGVEPIFIDVELTDRKEVFETDTIYIREYIN
jgi:hypothetical protein